MEISENTEFEEEMLLCPSSKSDTIVPAIKSMLWDALGASRKLFDTLNCYFWCKRFIPKKADFQKSYGQNLDLFGNISHFKFNLQSSPCVTLTYVSFFLDPRSKTGCLGYFWRIVIFSNFVCSLL